MEINRIIKSLLCKYPLFGNVITNTKFELTFKQVPAPAFTDGKTIFYKKELFFEYEESEIEFIIAHEIMHIVLKHWFRNFGKDQDLLNYVEDAIINQLLIRDRMKMPEGAVDVNDALDYSVDELYMRFLSMLDEIKLWMKSNTYHIEFELSAETFEQKYQQDLKGLMDDNSLAREELLNMYSERLKSLGYGSMALGQKFPSIAVGTQIPLANWINELQAKVSLSKEPRSSFCEVQMDGIIKKEEMSSDDDLDSEILVDTSSSMPMWKVKACLRECKNILKLGTVKVGFFDHDFYGWNDIKSSDDIDKLKIVGRGGTNFVLASESFTPSADNKIVITDGESTFPANPEIIWLVINDTYPIWISDVNNTNIIFVDENLLNKSTEQYSCARLLKQKKSK